MEARCLWVALCILLPCGALDVEVHVSRVQNVNCTYSLTETSLGLQVVEIDVSTFPVFVITGVSDNPITVIPTVTTSVWDTTDGPNSTVATDTMYNVQWSPHPPASYLRHLTVAIDWDSHDISAYDQHRNPLLWFDRYKDGYVWGNMVNPWQLKPASCRWEGVGFLAATLYIGEQPAAWTTLRDDTSFVLSPRYGVGVATQGVSFPLWGGQYTLRCDTVQYWKLDGRYPYPEVQLLGSATLGLPTRPEVVMTFNGVIDVAILDASGVEVLWGYFDEVTLKTGDQIVIQGNFVDPKKLKGLSNFTLTDCSFSNIVDSKGMFNMSVNVATGYSSHTLKITPSTKVKVTPDNQRMNFSFTCSNTDICTPSNPCDRTNLLYTDYQFTPPPTEISTDLSIQWLPLDEWWCPYHSPCYTPSLTSIPPKDASVHYASPGRVISAALIPRVFIGNQQNQPYDCLVGFYLSEYEIHDPVTVYLGDFEVPFHKFICADSAMHGNSQTLKFNLTRNSTDSCVVDCIGTTGIHHFSVGIVYDKCTCVYNEHIHVELPKFHLIMGQNETTKIELEYSASTYQDYGIHNWGINATYSNYNFDIPYFPTTPFYLNIRPAVANITIAVDSGKNVTYLLNSTFYESRNFPLKKPITLGNGIWNATAPWVDGWTVYSVLDYRGPPTENNITYEFSGIFPQPWNYSAVGVDMQLVPLDETDVTIGNPPYTCVAPSEHGHRILRCSTPGDTLRQMVAGWLNNAMELPTAGKVMMARILFFMKNMLVEVHSTYRRPVSTNTFALSVHEWPQCEGCKNIALIVGGVGLFLLVFVCVLVRIARHPVKVEYEDE